MSATSRSSACKRSNGVRRERTPLVLALVVREEASIRALSEEHATDLKVPYQVCETRIGPRPPPAAGRLAHAQPGRAFAASAGGGIRTPKPLRAAVLKTAVYPSST